jgi:hypothetical protein
MGLRRVRAADSALCGAARWLTWLAAWALAAAAAPAQTLESVLRPGDVIAGHAKWEDDCAQCHVRFDRAAQDRLCMACHKDVGQDMRDRAGYHGRLKPQPCRSCHTDHRGRNARIVHLDQAAFDHAATDYALRGRHLEVDCAACHVPGRKWSQAPHECNACHRKDDVHKGSLGPQCADCHGEQAWKPARFDHGKTRFALTGKHARAKCDACHRDGKTRDLPRACAACHREDDRRAHQGRLGERCESCHDARAWRPASFNHDTATRFALRGKHRGVKCADCHGGAPANAPFAFAREKPGSACLDCHRKDDPHEGRLGADCASCHTERSWKERGRFDHDKTAFALRGGHVQARCEACHKNANHRDTPKECVACHRNDDRHRGTLSTACADCHDERSWKSAPRFDHARTRFALRHAHAVPAAPSVPGAGAGGGRGLTCQACHADATRMRGTPLDCASCHAKHDRHEGQLGPRCESCHDERSWKVAAFDHTRTRFALLGRHAQTACKDCHASPRFKDASRECAACHAKDDHHRGRFGTACESCHNPRHWALWHFDHAKRTRFVLEGAHATLACERCHGQPAPKGKAAAPLGDTCLACHRRDDVHDGAFGAGCERCHTTERWKPVRPMRPHPAAASRAEPPAQGRRP